jgi:hypothetical protein
MIPRDVTTRWNSTFDMLYFAITYRAALDKVTGDRDFSVTYHAALDKVIGDRDMNLRKYELNDKEWNLATKLRDVLKVSWPSTPKFIYCDFMLD